MLEALYPSTKVLFIFTLQPSMYFTTQFVVWSTGWVTNTRRVQADAYGSWNISWGEGEYAKLHDEEGYIKPTLRGWSEHIQPSP